MTTDPNPHVPPPAHPAAAPPAAPVGWVIAGMILFWPTGIPALLASHRAARAIGAADTAVAEREAANARRWGIISVIVGAALAVLAVLASIAWAFLAAWALHGGIHDRHWERGPGWSYEMPGDSAGPMLPDRRS